MQTLAINKIAVDPEIDPRAEQNQGIIDEYAGIYKLIAGGKVKDEFPPVDVFYDGKKYWLADGFKRVAAAKKAKHAMVKVNVQAGNRRDAMLFACGCNDSHGERRSNLDRRMAVARLVADEEWVKQSNSWIALHAKVSIPFVRKVRTELEALPDYTTSASGKEVPTSHKSPPKKKVGKSNIPAPVEKALSAKVKKAVDAGEVEASAAELEALAQYDKGSQGALLEQVEDGLSLAEVIEADSGEVVCTHEKDSICPRCSEPYCSTCDPDHEGDCESIKVIIAPTASVKKQKAMKALDVLIKAMFDLDENMVDKLDVELILIKGQIEERK